MRDRRKEAVSRDEVYNKLLLLQNRHLKYFREIQKELIDCVSIHDNLSISIKSHLTLKEDVIADLKLNFSFENE
jgi:hypothetical protein